MHPALSVIFFTVASGAGYGLFVLLAIAHLFGLVDVDGNTMLWGGVLSLFLITAGLLSSVGHLANPKNAWRAFFRFRTSWLSREGVFAVLFYPFGFFYLLAAWLADGAVGALTLVLGVLAVLLALITVFCTGMIYGCLKTIRQWNTSLTPTNYLLLGLASGAVLLVMLLLFTGQQASG
ncbi:MAG: dimethyl sulfoxide reductase anchor subunit family protein, partial [Thiolinea sp.]